ncbi:MAG: nicotinamidase [Patescibacteria group bacterium]
MSKIQTIPMPSFFSAANAGEWGYRPDVARLAELAPNWAAEHGIKASGTDDFRLHVLGIDQQRDFCFPEGTLFVGGRSGSGAIDDSARFAEYIYRNLGIITRIDLTFDTHFAFQIFFPWFWVDTAGKTLQAHTLIVVSDDGKSLSNIGLDGSLLHEDVRPNPAMTSWLANGNYGFLCQYALHYCKQLKEGGKYTLYLWPPHCLLGGEGHALVGVIHEAHMFHALVRGSQNNAEVKGGNPFTENYSVFRSEVLTRQDGQAIAQRNTHFLKTLTDADAVVIGGQAASHCVKSSIDDLLDEIMAQDAGLARKVYILKDCMSSVAIPDGSGGFAVDFTDETEKAFERFTAAGMHLVLSTDPMDTWPDLNLA